MSTPTLHASVTLDRITFTWPDGQTALDGVSGAFGSGRTGLVGRNGSGKSTLLRRLMAGELTPTSGFVHATGDIAYLPQRLTLDVDRRVAELLGVAEPLDAVRAIAAGDVDPAHFDAVGDDWDIEARAEASLAEAGLQPEFLDRRIGELSGGEAVLVAIAGIRLRRAPITLLDEPTNNLDRDARAKLSHMVRSWKGALIVVSHDVSLLELMDETAEVVRARAERVRRALLGVAPPGWTPSRRPPSRRRSPPSRSSARRSASVSRPSRSSRRGRRWRTRPRSRSACRRSSRTAGRWPRRSRPADSARRSPARRMRHAPASRRGRAPPVRPDSSMKIELPDPQVSRSRRIADHRRRRALLGGPGS